MRWIVIQAATIALLPLLSGVESTYGGQAQLGVSQSAMENTNIPPDQIIARMAEVYATCESYRDQGIVTDRGTTPFTARLPFKTAFVRPDKLRFEFEDRAFDDFRARYADRIPVEDQERYHSQVRKYIVWQNGAQVRTWWYIRGSVEVESSLSSALAGATGVSGASAHVIPRLLLPDKVKGRTFADMRNSTLLGEESVDGFRCFRIRGQLGDSGSDYEIWIDKLTYMIRKITDSSTKSEKSWQSVISYDPSLNVTIPPEDLEFNTPQ